mmetsp:Transcript_21224/g.34212  ORF Transcript_21224/g.34212 Transcript_21224/m.34212 type:complete len:106 (-) Transcript_21224:275-592(-)
MFFLFKVALSIQRACSRYVLETINVARKYKRRLQRRRPTVEIDNSSSALAKGAPRDNSIAQKKGVGLFSAFFSGKQSKKEIVENAFFDKFLATQMLQQHLQQAIG